MTQERYAPLRPVNPGKLSNPHSLHNPDLASGADVDY